MKELIVLVSLIAMVSPAWASYRDVVIADNPLSFWEFEDAASYDGAPCADTMGMSPGVYRGPGIELVPGIVGQAAKLHNGDGNCNFIHIPDSAYSTVPYRLESSPTLSLEFWTKASVQASETYGRFISHANGGTANYWVGETQSGDNAGQPFVGVPGGTWYAWPPNILTNGNWHHVVITYDYDGTNTTAELWIDAQSRGTNTVAGAFTPPDDWSDLLIGAENNIYWPYNGLVGQMDEVAYYNYALSGAQVTAHFNAIPEPAIIVNVNPWDDPNITTFDPCNRPPDMDPCLDGDARPRVDSNCSFTGQWDANGTYKVNDVNVTIKGHTDIRVCQDPNGEPNAKVLDHEANGHNSLNGYVYQDANKIIEDAFRNFPGKRYVGEGNTPQQRDANALQQAQDDAKKLMDRAIDAIIQNMDKLGEKFDELTNHGIGPTEDDPNALTNEQGVEAVKKGYESAPKAGQQPAKPDEKQEEQSGVDKDESSLFFDDSEQKLYLSEGQVLSTASNPSDTILGRGEVHIDPIVLVGVQENGTVLLSDTRLKIIDNMNGGTLLDGFILETAYMESTLPGFAGMIQGYLDVPPAWAGGINNTIGSEFLAGIQAASEAGDCNRLPMVWFYADQQLFDGQGESSTPPTGASGKLILGVAVASEPNVVKVQIHIINGSGLTEAQVREGLKKTNEADANAGVRFVVDSNHYHNDPNTDPNDPNNNDPNRINIWTVRRCKVTGEPNNVSGCKGNIVELVDPNATKDPNDANAPKVYMKDSTLAHELNHILGLDHNEPNGHPITDPNNKMYPDNWKDAGVRTSCHRKGVKLEPWQLEKIRKSKVLKAKDAVDSGYGGDTYDDVGDVDFGYIDLDWSQAWIEWLSPYVLHLTAQVGSLSFESYSELGFYIESDGNPSTGRPPEGLDYYVAFQPASNQIIFEIYDAGWVPLEPNGITYELTYTWKDADVPPVPSGVKFELPMALLHRRAGNVISYRAVAQNGVQMDVSPNAGLLSVALPPWLPDFVPDGVIDYKDLDVLTDNWLSSPPIDPNVDLYPDGRIDFRDFAEFGKYWRQERQ